MISISETARCLFAKSLSGSVDEICSFTLLANNISPGVTATQFFCLLRVFPRVWEGIG